MRRTRVLFSIMAMTVLFTGCGDDGDSEGAAPSEDPGTEAPAPTDEGAPPESDLPVATTTNAPVEPEVMLTIDGTVYDDFEIESCDQFLDDDPLDVGAFAGEDDGSWSLVSNTASQPGGEPRVIAIRSANTGDPSQLPDFFDQQGPANVVQEFTALADEFMLTTVDDVATLTGTGVTFTNEGDPATDDTTDDVTISADLTITC